MQHEQSSADIFRDFIKEQACKKGYKFHAFSLDGQDRDAGADYVLTDSDRLAIVEFKYAERNLISEKYKPRRLTLCQELLNRQDMVERHDKCHFITWSESNSGLVKVNIYRKEICNVSVFGSSCGLIDTSPDKFSQVTANTFVDEFFDSRGLRSLSLNEFETYLAWILKETSASTKSTVELLARNPNTDELSVKRLNSIAEALNWVKDNIPPPPTPHRTRRLGR